jgi:hypothetical protein
MLHFLCAAVLKLSAGPVQLQQLRLLGGDSSERLNVSDKSGIVREWWII